MKSFLIETESSLRQDRDYHGANLSFRNLSNMNLDHYDFFSSSFLFADLSGADLSFCQLQYCDLSHSLMIGANLVSSNLFKACIHQANLNWAIYDDQTLLPISTIEASDRGMIFMTLLAKNLIARSTEKKNTESTRLYNFKIEGCLKSHVIENLCIDAVSGLMSELKLSPLRPLHFYIKKESPHAFITRVCCAHSQPATASHKYLWESIFAALREFHTVNSKNNNIKTNRQSFFPKWPSDLLDSRYLPSLGPHFLRENLQF